MMPFLATNETTARIKHVGDNWSQYKMVNREKLYHFLQNWICGLAIVNFYHALFYNLFAFVPAMAWKVS